MVRNGRYIHRIPQCCKDGIKNTIENEPTISNSALVRRFGVSMTSVKNIRKKLENTQKQ